jgi:hypothetical protein
MGLGKIPLQSIPDKGLIAKIFRNKELRAFSLGLALFLADARASIMFSKSRLDTKQHFMCSDFS